MTSITDTCLIVATVAGPVLAVQTQKFIERATERTRAQRGIFNTLMATRAARVSAAHVEALNAIDLHFRKNGWRSRSVKEREVSRRWRIYADHLNTVLDGSISVHLFHPTRDGTTAACELRGWRLSDCEPPLTRRA